MFRKSHWTSQGMGAKYVQVFAGTVCVLAVVMFVMAFALPLVRNRVESPGLSAMRPFYVWLTSSLSRVGPTEPPTLRQAISISGARGEIVDVQLVVRAAGRALTNLNIAASSLAGPNGATIRESNISLFREHYITVAGTARYGNGSNPPLGSGVYPEPLIPFNDPATDSPLCGSDAVLKACNASVSIDRNQPYWIDISIPRGAGNTPPGNYTGRITVDSDQGMATIPVTVTIWDFELPRQPSELSLWTLWVPAPGNTLTTLNRALMRNKVMGWYELPSQAAADVAGYGLTRSALNLSDPVDIRCDGSSTALPESEQLQAAAKTMPGDIELDVYLADELNGCPNAYAALRTIGQRVHASLSKVQTLLTTNTPDANLFNEGDGRTAIDHWALLASMEQWPALPFAGGGDLWSYTSCNTGFGNAPEWMIDYPPINERIQAGFLNWTQGATGILYYRADGWTAGNALASWNDLNTTACGGALGRPGDGIFVYPPGPIASSEPAPGIRLKSIRDGIQDYEYARALKGHGQEDFVNSVLHPIAASWTNWSHDPSSLERARHELGQRLNQITSIRLSSF